jgi:hypothetical protein
MGYIGEPSPRIVNHPKLSCTVLGALDVWKKFVYILTMIGGKEALWRCFHGQEFNIQQDCNMIQGH